MKKTFKFLLAAVALLGLAACADVPELPYPLPDDEGIYGKKQGNTIPFNSNSLNDFMVFTIEGSPWSPGKSYSKATGYDSNSKETTATKTWLVSPAINTTISAGDSAVVTFDYVLRYVKSSTDVKNWHKVLVSKDYVGDITTATWVDLGFEGYEEPNNTSWTFYASDPLALPAEFLNEEKVYIAFYFQCDGSNSTTWELKNFSLKKGTGKTPKPNPGPTDVKAVTVAEFLKAPVNTTDWYELVGTATGINSSDVYGNFDLTDETGKVYVYGLLSEKGGATREFQTLVKKTGLANKDKIKIHATRGDFNGTAEAVNAYFVEIVERGGDDGGTIVGEGDGTEQKPYNVAYVRSADNPGKSAWVKGYIVGTVKDGSQTYNDAVFGTDNASNTNFLLADDPACTDATKCIPVQLPAGVRDALSLQKNPSILGKLVLLNGTLEKYFGQPGLKNVGKYSFDISGGGGDDGSGDDTGAFFSVDFLSGDGGFTAQNVVLNDISYVWNLDGKYGWKASAYQTTNHASESWLVSPSVSLASKTSATMTVNQAVNFTNGAPCTDFLSICVSSDYNGDVKTASWTVLTVPTWPSGADWTFVESGDISLDAFCGKNVTIAFRYTSTADVAPTWEIKSLSVK